MNIELRKIKYSARLSEETPAFAAEIWIDGVKRGTAKNDGHGGCNWYDPHALEDELNAIAKTLPKVKVDGVEYEQDADGAEYEQDADLMVNELLERQLEGKRLKRMMSKKIVFVQGGQIWTGTGRPGPNRPGAVILNDLPFEKALDVFMSPDPGCTAEPVAAADPYDDSQDAIIFKSEGPGGPTDYGPVYVRRAGQRRNYEDGNPSFDGKFFAKWFTLSEAQRIAKREGLPLATV